MNPEPLKSAMANASQHPSDEDLDDVLIGIGSPQTTAHLAQCPACRTQLAHFESALGTFNQATLAWSEARSNALPIELQPVPARAWLSRFSTPERLSLGAAALFALGLSLASGVHEYRHHRSESQIQPLAATSTHSLTLAADREREIASDNAMLQAIDSELFTPVLSPQELYATPRSSRGRKSESRQVRD